MYKENGMKTKHLVVGLFLLMAALALAACGPEPTPCPTAAPCPECPEADCPEVECPETECPACPECPDADAIAEEAAAAAAEAVPYAEEWVGSGHAASDTEAFRHWDEDDPPEVPESCAKCHTTTGYLDFLGEDGSEFGVVNSTHDPAEGIECVACHNDTAAAMDSVVFPSGAEVTGLGPQSRCMQCHQGRASKVQVDEVLAETVGEDLDTVSEELGFINIHYYAAGASRLGSEVQGGYEYDGMDYDVRFEHVPGYFACNDCHDQHTLELKLDECAVCHTDAASAEDLVNVRMAGSLADYDGDGDIEEGIYFELEGLQEMLYTAIQAYAAEVAGTPIVYESHAYPYFFIDTNGDGLPDEDEANYGNQYASWTGRLLQAAYNYQTSQKDPGGYTHGGKYHIQLLYDSIADLNTAISTPVDLSTAHREDPGHFAASKEAWRHWDEDGEVSSSCAKCHSGEGLAIFLKEGTNISAPIASSMACSNCHDSLTEFTRYVVDEVEFPSGAVLTFGEGNDANLCINCHQARNSSAGVDAYIASFDVSDDEAGEGMRFQNPHYFPAGATLFGTEAGGAYEYEGQGYNGRFAHVPGFATCIECHDAHALGALEDQCGTCHAGIESVADIRITEGDFDCDGDAEEGIAGEVETMTENLFEAIQAYAEANGAPIVYDSHAYPYFFNDTNGNGEADPDEANFGNQYSAWTPRLLRAAYNYQWAAKDPGSFAHNGMYMLQALYDSLNDMGYDVACMIRPAVEAAE
jgi:hypothetical protein